MPIRLLALPLSPEELTKLGQEGYALIDQFSRQTGVLVAQAPDEDAANGKEPTPEPVPLARKS